MAPNTQPRQNGDVNRPRRWTRTQGSKLIELMLALLITALMVAVSLPMSTRLQEHAKEVEGLAVIKLIATAQKTRFVEAGEFSNLDQLGLGIEETEYYRYVAYASGSDLDAEVVSGAIAKGNHRSFWIRLYVVIQDESQRIEVLHCDSYTDEILPLAGMTTCPQE